MTSSRLTIDNIDVKYKPDINRHYLYNPHLKHLTNVDLLRNTIITNIIYKPLYTIEEITNMKFSLPCSLRLFFFLRK